MPAPAMPTHPERTYRPDDVMDQPLDVERHIAGLSEDVTTKGYVVSTFYEHIAVVRPEAIEAYARLHPERPAPAADVSVREFARRLVDAARLAHPDVPLPEGLRRVGRSLYRSVIASLLGRLVLTAEGTDFEHVASQGPAAYQAFEKQPTPITYHRLGDRHFRYDYSPGRPFVGCYQVGVIEGAAMAHGHSPEMTVRLVDDDHGSIECRY
jgi:hypothetical protein